MVTVALRRRVMSRVETLPDTQAVPGSTLTWPKLSTISLPR
jgi:hypothetical protein